MRCAQHYGRWGGHVHMGDVVCVEVGEKISNGRCGVCVGEVCNKRGWGSGERGVDGQHECMLSNENGGFLGTCRKRGGEETKKKKG